MFRPVSRASVLSGLPSWLAPILLAACSHSPPPRAAGPADASSSSKPGDLRGGSAPFEASPSATATEPGRSDLGAASEGQGPRSSGAAGDSAESRASLPEKAGLELVDGRVGNPGLALPAFRTRHIGMHIGGESNTDQAKRPWLAAIERQEGALLICYRLVKEPLAGGTLGVDLLVTSEGGAPTVRKIRQRLGDAAFEDCVSLAFQGVRFARPARPTVLSYSLRFEVEGLR